MRLEIIIRRGVLIDANILLLWFVGGYDVRRIESFKRTQQFSRDDYKLLLRFLGLFRIRVVTPNILTEVNSLSSQLPGHEKEAYFANFRDALTVIREEYVQSAKVGAHEQFSKCGLTDCGILMLAKEKYLVLTDDLLLYRLLSDVDVDVINFNHLRQAAGIFG